MPHRVQTVTLNGGQLLEKVNSLTFYVGQFSVFPENNTISHDGREVHLEPQVMNVLQVLSTYRESVAPRDELMDRAWPNEIIADESLTRSVSMLRKAFSSLSENSKIIQTVHKKGYRLLVAVAYPSILNSSDEDFRASIAVLPFSDLSRDSQNQHFSAGMSEEILNALSNISDLRVVGRTSAFAFKGKNLDVEAIISSLNVKYILDGAIRIVGERIRVSAKLLDTGSKSHVWSKTYDVELAHVFDVQETIAQSISEAIQSKLSTPSLRLAQKMTHNPEAYHLFLQGRAVNQRTYADGALETAERLLTQAIKEDPNFAQAHVELARTFIRASNYVKRAEKMGRITAAAERAQHALSLDPNQYAAKTIVALKKYVEGDIVGAIELAESAYHAQSNNPEIASNLGCYFLAIGRVKAAMPYLEKAVALDPVQGRPIQILAIAKLSNGELSEAEALAKRSLDMGYAYAIDTYAAVAYAMGDKALAMKRIISLPQNILDIFGESFANRALWETGIKGFYSGEETAAKVSTQIALSMLKSPDVIEENSPAELMLSMSLLRAGAAEELFQMIGDTPSPGSHAVLLNFWGEGAPYSKIYNHPDFIPFAERIGFMKAWRKYGWPDRLL